MADVKLRSKKQKQVASDVAVAKLMTITDVAEYLGVGKGLVYRELQSGRLVGIKMPGAHGWRVHPDDVKSWLDARRNVRREDPDERRREAESNGRDAAASILGAMKGKA